ECQAGVVFQRPGVAALEVGVPVDGLAQLDLTRAEQIEAVGENVLCLVKRDLPRLWEELRGECGVLGDQREEARRLALVEVPGNVVDARADLDGARLARRGAGADLAPDAAPDDTG